MLDKPPLEDARIAAGLREAYGLAVDAIEFLPRGYDSNAGVYRVRAGVETYFLKAKRNAVDELAVTLPRALQAHGLEEVVAPLPTVNGAPWGTVDGFTLLLYPFIEEQGAELTDAQWIAFGAFLKKLHTTHLPADLVRRLPRERFVPHPRLNVLYRDLQATVPHQDYAHPVQQQLAAFWRAREAELAAILDRAEQLGRMLQGQDLPFVLCHADIHTGNLLLPAPDRLCVVDWDDVMLAPIERDLMFVTVGGFVTDERHEALFFEGYGAAPINPVAMAYYRYERAMQDLAEFALQVFRADSSDATKQDSLEWFMVQFAPGGTVEAAHALSSHILPG